MTSQSRGYSYEDFLLDPAKMRFFRSERGSLILALDGGDEIADLGIATQPSRSAPRELGKPGEALHQGQHSLVTIALDGPGEAVDGRGHSMPRAPLLAR